MKRGWPEVKAGWEKLERKIPMVAMRGLRDWRDNGDARIHG